MTKSDWLIGMLMAFTVVVTAIALYIEAERISNEPGAEELTSDGQVFERLMLAMMWLK